MLDYELPNLLNMIAVQCHHFVVLFLVSVTFETKERTKVAHSVPSPHGVPFVYGIEPCRNISQWHEPCCVGSILVQSIEILDLGENAGVIRGAAFIFHTIHLAVNIEISTLAEDITGCIEMPLKAISACPRSFSATPMTSFETGILEQF